MNRINDWIIPDEQVQQQLGFCPRKFSYTFSNAEITTISENGTVTPTNRI